MKIQPLCHDEKYVELLRSPFWQVQVVFDPDGGGADFAYTIGLHDRGLPELHVWARPDLGEDPGEDWMLSPQDRCRLLNQLAARLVHGELGPGSELSDEMDGGHTTVRMRVDAPSDREALEAYGIAVAATVLPVRWSLHRPPEGASLAISAAVRRMVAPEVARLCRAMVPTERGPRGWEILARDSQAIFDDEQPYGPLTALVVARGAQLWQADDATLVRALHLGIALDADGLLDGQMGRISALGRSVGRRGAVDRVHRAVHELTWWVTSARPSRDGGVPWCRASSPRSCS